MNSYREKLTSSILYWIILSIPLAYFLITYFYQFFLANFLISYLEVDPVTVSISIVTFFTLSKPIGGLVFGVAFWNISKIISYEINIRTAMIIAGSLLFSANQASTQVVGPYPPFGLVTVTLFNIAAYLMLLGIYSSATLVSANNNLRKSIYKQAMESKLLGLIGDAEMGKLIEKTIKVISKRKDRLEQDMPQGLELDEAELKKYVNFVIKEVNEKADRK